MGYKSSHGRKIMKSELLSSLQRKRRCLSVVQFFFFSGQ